jgi:hypothetical protein
LSHWLGRSLTIIFNKSIIIVTSEQIKISNVLIPWFGKKVIDISQIHSFAWQKQTNAEGGGKYYAFHCVLMDKEQINFFPGIPIVKPQEAKMVLEKISRGLTSVRSIDIVEL